MYFQAIYLEGEVRRKEERVEINIDFVFHYTQWSTHLQHTIPVPDECFNNFKKNWE